MNLRLGLRIRTTVAHVTLGAALSASLAIAVTLLIEDMEERFLHATMLESLDLLVQIGRRQEQPGTSCHGISEGIRPDPGTATPRCLNGSWAWGPGFMTSRRNCSSRSGTTALAAT